MADQKSSTSVTSPTSNESTSTETEAKTPRKVQHGEIAKSRTFRIPSHCETVLQIMNKQRNTGEFCDITVLVEHQRFSAHKSVLAANSAYFKNLLATGNDGIFLHHITAESFAAILDFMYTSRLHLEPSTVQDVLSAAKFLQVKGVISICCRYLESQIRVLARDTDENKMNSNKPTVLTVDPGLLKGTAFPSISPIQQQPHLTYNPNTGLFVSAAPAVTGLKPVVIGGDQIQQRAMMMPYQSTRPQHGAFSHNASQIQQPHSNFNNIQQHFALKPRNVNPAYPPRTNQNAFQQTLPQSLPARPSVILPQVSYPGQAVNPATTNFNPSVRHPNYPLAFPPHDQKGNHFSAGVNPFSYDEAFLNPAHPNFSQMGAPVYASKSTGGKGRRQHLPARRKGGYGSVSAGAPSIRFTFGDAKNFPSTSTPKDSKMLNNSSTPEEQILLLSSARESKSSSKEKKPATPETVFDVEAEDRYWDALSTRTQNQNENQ